MLGDVDNKVKFLIDALKKPDGKKELGAGTPLGMATPQIDETPFFVLLQDDKLITHLAVRSDMLLERIADTPADHAARVAIDVTIRPYDTTLDNLAFA